MNIVVQKFGGTSVATRELREKVANKVINTKRMGKCPVVVVSAIGRQGDPYSTDTLVQLARNTYKEFSSRELDLIMSCGEIISSVILANTIKSMGHDAVALTGFQAGIITDNNYGEAEVLKVENESVLRCLQEGKIPVIAGFQGISQNGDITTLGRGGSDTTAALLGEALSAEVVEIYTDVDGVMTADPRIVSDAKVIENICYNEIFQMAAEGAKVVHPRAVEIARRGNVILKIKNTFTDASGTIINNQVTYKKKYSSSIDHEDLITAIAHKNNIAQTTIHFEDSKESNELLMNELAQHKISIDLINFFIDRKVFTIEEKDIEILEMILKNYNFNYKILKNCSKVTIIGHKMRGVPGVMARIVKALSNQDIQILQSSDSHMTIACLVNSCNVEKAVKALHKEFYLSQ